MEVDSRPFLFSLKEILQSVLGVVVLAKSTPAPFSHSELPACMDLFSLTRPLSHQQSSPPCGQKIHKTNKKMIFTLSLVISPSFIKKTQKHFSMLGSPASHYTLRLFFLSLPRRLSVYLSREVCTGPAEDNVNIMALWTRSFMYS